MRAIRLPVVLLSLIVTLASLTGSTPAMAETYRDASAGVACHPANGALAANFNRNLHYLTNVGTTDAYVVCSLVMYDETSVPAATHLLRVDVQYATAGSTVTCVAQLGAYYSGSAHIYKSYAVTYTAPNDSTAIAMSWDTADLQRTASHQVLLFNCKMAPGSKLGLIQFWE